MVDSAQTPSDAVQLEPAAAAPEDRLTEVEALDTIVIGRPTRYRDDLVSLLVKQGHRVAVHRDVRAAIAKTKGQIPGTILLGPGPGSSNFPKAVALLKRHYPLVDVVPFARQTDPDTVVKSIRFGARDFLIGRGLDDFVERLDYLFEQQQYIPRLQQLRHDLAKHNQFEGMLSRSRKMWDVFEVVERVADTDATVLIEGETGTGKELLARAVYRRSRRRRGPFLTVDCGAMAETLLDSELFGHEKGAFTGASARKIGLFEQAKGGTLLLDEIGNVSESMQQRLLRVLETGRFRRVGQGPEITTDARIIAATNRDLQAAVTAGEFREDLFYRLNVIRLVVPPLRQRPEDILFMLNHYLGRFARQYRTKKPVPSDRVIDLLLSYDWPGNVRELQNIAERLVLVSRTGQIDTSHLPATLTQSEGRGSRSAKGTIDVSRPIGEVVGALSRRAEQDYLTRVLKKYQGKIQATATHAGISRRTLHRKMLEYGLDKRSFKKSQ